MKNYKKNINFAGDDRPQRLRGLRESQHLSQSDLAEKAGLSYRTIHDLELGKRKRVQEKTLLLVAKALGISLEDLIGDSPTEGIQSSPANHKRRWTTAGLVIAVVLVIAAGFLWHTARIQAKWSIDDHNLVVRDAIIGLKLWDFSNNSSIHSCEVSPWNSQHLLVATGRQDPEGGRFLCLERASGKLVWSVGPDIPAIVKAFGEDVVYSSKFSCKKPLVGDLNGDGVPEIALLFTHGKYFPTAIVVVDSDGVRQSQYAHRGHIFDWSIEDIDGDGKDEIVAAGTNNTPAYEGATVLVLDDLHRQGASIDSLSNPWSSLPDSALVRTVLPNFPPPYMNLLQEGRLGAWSLQVFQNKKGKCMISVDVGGHEPFERVIVQLDSGLHPVSAVPTDRFKEVVLSQWPDSTTNGTGPGDPVWLAHWFSGYLRFEAGHRSSP